MNAADVYAIRQDLIDGGKSWYAEVVVPPTSYLGYDSPDNRVENLGWAEDTTALPRIIVNPTGGLVTSESGDTATFEVKLGTQPTGNVKIDFRSSDTSEGTVDTASLTFDGSDWDTPKPVKVTGVDDADADGDIAYQIITDPAVSSDSNYNGLDPVDVLSSTSMSNRFCLRTASRTASGTASGSKTARTTGSLRRSGKPTATTRPKWTAERPMPR